MKCLCNEHGQCANETHLDVCHDCRHHTVVGYRHALIPLLWRLCTSHNAYLREWRCVTNQTTVARCFLVSSFRGDVVRNATNLPRKGILFWPGCVSRLWQFALHERRVMLLPKRCLLTRVVVRWPNNALWILVLYIVRPNTFVCFIQGQSCEFCEALYVGDARNNGTCVSCYDMCNNRADVCMNSTQLKYGRDKNFSFEFAEVRGIISRNFQWIIMWCTSLRALCS